MAAVEQDELKSDDNWKTTEGVADMLKEYENAMCRYQIEIMKMESIRHYRKKVTQNTEWCIGCEKGKFHCSNQTCIQSFTKIGNTKKTEIIVPKPMILPPKLKLRCKPANEGECTLELTKC